MKLAALAASVALAVAPLSALANDTQSQPLPGGVAKSSQDIELGSPTLLAAVLAAGGALVIGTVVVLVANDSDGNPVLTTTTTTP